MKCAPLSSLALFAVLLANCAGSHAPKPTGYFHNGWYWYEFPCSGWTEPARVVVNRAVGPVDTTLAVLSGRVPNFRGGDYAGSYAVMVLATQGADAAPVTWAETDAQGRYRLGVPSGTYRVKFLGMGFYPFAVDSLALRAGQAHRLDVFLHVMVSNAGSCVHKSRRPISQAKVDTMLARRQARWVRRYMRGAKQRAAADARSAAE